MSGNGQNDMRLHGWGLVKQGLQEAKRRFDEGYEQGQQRAQTRREQRQQQAEQQQLNQAQKQPAEQRSLITSTGNNNRKYGTN